MVYQIWNCWKTKSNPCRHDKSLTRRVLKFTGSKFHDKYSAIGIYAMAPHSSTLAWNIPWMEEPGRLQSMGSLRVGHD